MDILRIVILLLLPVLLFGSDKKGYFLNDYFCLELVNKRDVSLAILLLGNSIALFGLWRFYLKDCALKDKEVSQAKELTQLREMIAKKDEEFENFKDCQNSVKSIEEKICIFPESNCGHQIELEVRQANQKDWENCLLEIAQMKLENERIKSLIQLFYSEKLSSFFQNFLYNSNYLLDQCLRDSLGKQTILCYTLSSKSNSLSSMTSDQLKIFLDDTEKLLSEILKVVCLFSEKDKKISKISHLKEKNTKLKLSISQLQKEIQNNKSKTEECVREIKEKYKNFKIERQNSLERILKEIEKLETNDIDKKLEQSVEKNIRKQTNKKLVQIVEKKIKERILSINLYLKQCNVQRSTVEELISENKKLKENNYELRNRCCEYQQKEEIRAWKEGVQDELEHKIIVLQEEIKGIAYAKYEQLHTFKNIIQGYKLEIKKMESKIKEATENSNQLVKKAQEDADQRIMEWEKKCLLELENAQTELRKNFLVYNDELRLQYENMSIDLLKKFDEAIDEHKKLSEENLKCVSNASLSMVQGFILTDRLKHNPYVDSWIIPKNIL